MKRDLVLPVVLGAISFLCMCAWAAINILGPLFVGGDGASAGPQREPLAKMIAIVAIGSGYFFYVFISCFPFMAGKLMKVSGIIAHLILAPFAVQAVLGAGLPALILAVPFAVVAAGWFALYRRKRFVPVRISKPDF